ncbi:MAG: hypothetical protein K0R33_4187, partial [Mycobacterium sp.]|nr:hypothetical protein [Mycobacterium sp.]
KHRHPSYLGRMAVKPAPNECRVLQFKTS